MPDLLDPTDPSRGDRTVNLPAARTPAPTVHSVSALRGATEVSPRTAPTLLFDHVTKWYGPVVGINQVTLELRKGITALVGANGAGKSTLLRLAAGQLRPDLGRVLIRDHRAWTAAAKRHVGYCPDVDAFYEEMSGRGFLYAMARLCGFTPSEAWRRVDVVLDRVGMNTRSERPMRGYSKGMRQRIKLAQALINDPELLILDEPFSGIDPVGRQDFIALFRELAAQDKCLLISSHELEELEKLTDHVAVMARGRIAAVGTLAQIRDLLDNHPLSIRIDCPQYRELAGALVGLPDVVGLEFGEGDKLVVQARNPRRFFQGLTELVLEEHFEVVHLETLDDSAQAVLGYLLGGRS